jgi:Fe-S cluster biogenesis protein NfuA
MFIETQPTPNPETIKFLPGETVLPSGSAEFVSAADAAGRSPLAERLFEIEGVDRVFFGQDFISVTKHPAKEWMRLKPLILAAIFEQFSGDLPLLMGASDEAEFPKGEDNAAVAQIRELLETRIRPALARDGGDVVFRGFDRGIVYLQMRGACSGCPSATMTLKMGIENMLRHYVPEVLEVRAAQDND